MIYFDFFGTERRAPAFLAEGITMTRIQPPSTARSVAVDASELSLPRALGLGLECRHCGAEMKLEQVTKHAFSEVEYRHFVCNCGARDTRVLSRTAFFDD
jgi:hypothetical protein